MKKAALLVSTFVLTILAFGQNKHEISAYFGAGLASFKYNMSPSGETNSKFGVLSGLGYTYNIGSNWGLVTGLEIASYKSDIQVPELKDHYMTQDNYGNDFEWRLTLNSLMEKQTGTYVNIPLMVQFTPKRVDNFFANLGFKVGIPLGGKYDAKYENLVASGYYPETNAEYTDIDFRGFGTFEGSSSTGDVDFEVAWMLSAECGMKWNLPNSMTLYAGGYIDYGLNSILKVTNYNRVFVYDKTTPSNLLYNSLLYGAYNNGTSVMPLVDKVVPLAFGLKVRLGFSFST